MNIIKERNADYLLAVTVFALVAFGLVMISSASAIESFENFGVNDYYFWHQLGSITIALAVWLFFQHVPYRLWRKLAFPGIIVTIIALSLVFVSGVGTKSGTFAQSWLDFPLLPSIQPAEFAKLGLILYLSDYYARKGTKVADLKEGFLPFILVVGTICGLIAMQPDFGTVLIMVIVAGSIYFAAGANLLHLFAGSVMGVVGVLLVVRNATYVFNRFIAFLNSDIDPQGIGYHIKQSLIAVGAGGLWGYGFGNSRQKFEYLPEAQGDSIFAIASEELGMLRVLPIVFAFTIIAMRGYKIAQQANDTFGKLVATGITTWITFQAFLNMAVVLSLAPTTGVTLPFISYGGSSLIATIAAVGILLNISKSTHEDRPYRRRVEWTREPAPRRRGRTRRFKDVLKPRSGLSRYL